MTDGNDTAEAVRNHASIIMRAAGSNLEHYETRAKGQILSAVMDCYEQAFRAGAAFAEMHSKDK